MTKDAFDNACRITSQIRELRAIVNDWQRWLDDKPVTSGCPKEWFLRCVQDKAEELGFPSPELLLSQLRSDCETIVRKKIEALESELLEL